jgi:hypothetical protein
MKISEDDVTQVTAQSFRERKKIGWFFGSAIAQIRAKKMTIRSYAMLKGYYRALYYNLK